MSDRFHLRCLTTDRFQSRDLLGRAQHFIFSIIFSGFGIHCSAQRAGAAPTSNENNTWQRRTYTPSQAALDSLYDDDRMRSYCRTGCGNNVFWRTLVESAQRQTFGQTAVIIKERILTASSSLTSLVRFALSQFKQSTTSSSCSGGWPPLFQVPCRTSGTSRSQNCTKQAYRTFQVRCNVSTVA